MHSLALSNQIRLLLLSVRLYELAKEQKSKKLYERFLIECALQTIFLNRLSDSRRSVVLALKYNEFSFPIRCLTQTTIHHC